MQKNWIGKSIGCEIDFDILNNSKKLKFLPHVQILYLVRLLSLYHQIILCLKNLIKIKRVLDFKKECLKVGTTEEAMANAEKKGFNTNFFASHPFIKNKKIPIYIANFILMDYGTGAIFGCPAHDQRDLDFAKKYKIEIIKVVSGNDDKHDLKEAYTGEGTLINSQFLDDLNVEEAKKKIIFEIEKRKIGLKKVTFRLKDWGISRQRYWGCPIPMIYLEDGTIVPVEKNELPIKLPDDIDLKKSGNPLEITQHGKKLPIKVLVNSLPEKPIL